MRYSVGLLPGAHIFGSYVNARARRIFNPATISSFEDWIVDKFGRKLYETFFQTYTEKVWGISCGADWASQRIKGLSPRSAITSALFKSNKGKIKTLIDEFSYPRFGAGQTYEKVAAYVRQRGGNVWTKALVRRIRRDAFTARAVILDDGTAVERNFHLVAMPLTEIVQVMDPPAPDSILNPHGCYLTAITSASTC
jgi:protoporphyrinogen oxidase